MRADHLFKILAQLGQHLRDRGTPSCDESVRTRPRDGYHRGVVPLEPYQPLTTVGDAVAVCESACVQDRFAHAGHGIESLVPDTGGSMHIQAAEDPQDRGAGLINPALQARRICFVAYSGHGGRTATLSGPTTLLQARREASSSCLGSRWGYNPRPTCDKKSENPMASWQRTHTCGELREDDNAGEVTLNGWVENYRDHGKVLFLDLRDRYGVTQVVVQDDDAELYDLARSLRAETVVSVHGVVHLRDADKVNSNRVTGDIEVVADAVEVLSEAQTPPFEVLDRVEANEELRMRYRYLDLRRNPMSETLRKRATFVLAVRNYLAEHAFIDVETPILTKSTPEGARDYLVPSRINPGQFFALPQSPQLFKQMLMVAGMDRYFQIARCFRDEDLRADRQPEFTQIDLEMSFVQETDVLDLVEGMMVHAMQEGFGIEVKTPFPRLSYADAMTRYGSDKPDTRFGLELIDVSELAGRSEFKVFSNAIEHGGVVQGLCVTGEAGNFSRKKIDELTKHVNEYGAKGLAWAKITEEGVTGSISKFYQGEPGDELVAAMDASPGDLLLFVADRRVVAQRALGELRVKLGTILGLRKPGEFHPCWVMNFPLFLHDEDTGTWVSSHHPFTAPVDWDVDFAADPGAVQSRAYDLVMNGWELGSGSIRIHRADVQKRLFHFLGIGEEEQQAKFGFLLDAFKFGAPPHGGIALGVDRIVTLALGCESIRDVIAFPKTARATDLMCDAPSPVAGEQLADLHIISTPPKD